MRFLRNDERIGWTAACDAVARVTFVAILVKHARVYKGSAPLNAHNLCDLKEAAETAWKRRYGERYTRGAGGLYARQRSTAIGAR